MGATGLGAQTTLPTTTTTPNGPPQPAPPQSPPPPVAAAAPVQAIVAYRAPALALVQPPPGALTVPQDRPVVVFRFAQGEAADPIDVSSFRVTVDGRDRTALFQIVTGEAWGPLAEADAAAPTTAAKDDKATAASRKARVFDLVLSAARRLLAP